MALLLVLVSCEDWNPLGPESDADTDTDVDTDTDADADTDVDPVDPDPPSPGTWTMSPHPCVGNRTDTMLVEGSTIWVGCGTTYDGFGLWRSTNSGGTWLEVAPNVLDSWRINDIHRSPDGDLYLAGIDTNGDGRGARLNSADQVEELLQNNGQLWNAMVTGSVRTTPSGDIAFESLNGTDVAFKGAGNPSFQDAYPWWVNGISKQILDLEAVGEDFYGCGSTISSPPVVFLPPPDGREGFQMAQVELTTAFDGELWDIHVDDDGILVAGVDQDENVGVLFVSGDNPIMASDWTMVRVESLYPGERTWLRGICRQGDKAYAVGEFSITEDALMLGSDNGGHSWYTVPLPDDTRALHVCAFDDDGTVHVAGADGFYGRYQP